MNMNKNEKRCQVYLIKNEDISIIRGRGDMLFLTKDIDYLSPFNIMEGNAVYYNLCITSDDEIKEGDWFLVELYKISGESIGFQLEKCKQIKDIWVNNFDVSSVRHINNCKKIIATTDKFLTINEPITGKDISYGIASFIKDKDAYYKCLPQPSESFISKYIECYNKDDIIKEVMVEYEYIPGGNRVRNFETAYIEKGYGLQPKVDKNNTITIRRIKDNWSREEVKGLCKSVFITGSRVNDIDYF